MLRSELGTEEIGIEKQIHNQNQNQNNPNQSSVLGTTCRFRRFRPTITLPELTFYTWPIRLPVVNLLLKNSQFFLYSSLSLIALLFIRIVKPWSYPKLFCSWCMKEIANHRLLIYRTKITFILQKLFRYTNHNDLSKIHVNCSSFNSMGFPFMLLAFFAFCTRFGKSL